MKIEWKSLYVGTEGRQMVDSISFAILMLMKLTSTYLIQSILINCFKLALQFVGMVSFFGLFACLGIYMSFPNTHIIKY